MFSFLNKAAIKVSIGRLAQKAASRDAFEGGSGTAFSTTEVIEGYFKKYGSTERKFDFHPQPGFYIGYVTVDRQEFLSVVVLGTGGSVAASFRPEINQGQDFLGLMAKKEFAEQVAEQFRTAGSGKSIWTA